MLWNKSQDGGYVETTSMSSLQFTKDVHSNVYENSLCIIELDFMGYGTLNAAGMN